MESEFSRIEVVGSVSRISRIVEEMGSGRHLQSIQKLGITGITVMSAVGCGVQSGSSESMAGVADNPLKLLPKSILLIVCETEKADAVIEFLSRQLYTGHIGDGKIFVSDVRRILRVRTGEEGTQALQESKVR